MGGDEGDDRLLARIAEGDRKAFAVVMERHLDRVFCLARRVLLSDGDAEEVAQEVFLTLWQKAENWRPGRARLSTWLYRVTLNRCLNHKARVQRRYHRPGGRSRNRRPRSAGGAAPDRSGTSGRRVGGDRGPAGAAAHGHLADLCYRGQQRRGGRGHGDLGQGPGGAAGPGPAQPARVPGGGRLRRRQA